MCINYFKKLLWRNNNEIIYVKGIWKLRSSTELQSCFYREPEMRIPIALFRGQNSIWEQKLIDENLSHATGQWMKIIGPDIHYCNITVHTLNHHFSVCYESPIYCVLSPGKTLVLFSKWDVSLQVLGPLLASNMVHPHPLPPTNTHQQMDLVESSVLLNKSKTWNVNLFNEHLYFLKQDTFICK